MHTTCLINLKRRSDRLEKFRKNNLDVSFTLVEGVDDKAAPRRGCRHSHLKVLRLAKASSLDFVIILEDDAVLRVSEKELVSLVEKVSLKEAFEILLLSISNGAHLLYTNLGTVADRNLFAVNHYFMGTYAMVVHRRAFDKLISSLEESLDDPDLDVDLGIYNKVCEGKIFLTVPFMADVLENDQSDIRANQNTNDDHKNVLWAEKVLMINADL